MSNETGINNSIQKSVVAKLLAGECIALLASGSANWDLPSMLELKAIGRTLSCEAVLAYFSHVCSASPTTSRRV